MGIQLNQVVKTFQNGGVSYTALKGIDLTIEEGQFTAIIGKSGCGKSTLMNMITGIDHPTSGDVIVGGRAIHTMKKSELAPFRGRNIGVIFQFFQLLPTLTLLENVMLPMDFCQMYTSRERKRRAFELLEQVGMDSHAYKLPSAVSGGQQQRVAIARALANDPPIIIADEPTGSLDSKTSELIFGIFKELAEHGKTIVMVTHDQDLACRVEKTVLMADGKIVNESVMQALPTLDMDQISQLQAYFQKHHFSPGSIIIREGDEADYAYIIVKGEVEVLIQHPSGIHIPVSRLGKGQYFGEIALVRGGKRTATVRAVGDQTIEVLALDRETFVGVIENSEATRQEIDEMIRKRLNELSMVGR